MNGLAKRTAVVTAFFCSGVCCAVTDWQVERSDERTCRISVRTARDWKSGAPRINGPSVFGATPGRVFSYAFPVCGDRSDMSFDLEGELPDGVRFDSTRGELAGRGPAGEWPLRFVARNGQGTAVREFRLKLGEGCRALTPPMGWTSWNAFGCVVTADRIRRAARALVDTGLAAHGWTYVNCDAGWAQDVGVPGVCRPAGPIRPNPAFADMAGMIRDIHALGLKAGVYSSPMVYTWASSKKHVFVGTGDYPIDRTRKPTWVPLGAETNGVGAVRHVVEDATQWADWGADWLKYDWNTTQAELGAEMRAALDATGRDIVLQLCTECRLFESNALAQVAELVRGNPDVKDVWEGSEGLAATVRALDRWLGYVGPGHWYDLDMLAVGRLSIDRATDDLVLSAEAALPSDVRFDNRLSRDEQIFHFVYWAFAPAPLFLSCELEGLSGLVLDLASNDELLSIHQDALGCPATFSEKDGVRFGSRPLANGARALAAFNFNDAPRRISVCVSSDETVRDVLSGCDEPTQDALTFVLPPHGARVFTASNQARKRE